MERVKVDERESKREKEREWNGKRGRKQVRQKKREERRNIGMSSICSLVSIQGLSKE